MTKTPHKLRVLARVLVIGWVVLVLLPSGAWKEEEEESGQSNLNFEIFRLVAHLLY